MNGGIEAGVFEQSRARDYLEDEVAWAFFSAREHEAYYRSLKNVDERRGFHDELKAALLRLLAVATGDAIRLNDEILQRSSPRPSVTGLLVRVRLAPDSEGLRLLGVDESVDFDRLREAYRAAALRHHPDRGGSNEAMQAVNLAYEQLHALISDRLAPGDEQTFARDGAESGADYLGSVMRLLFEIWLDDWALEEALNWLERLLAQRRPASAAPPPWQQINLIQPSLQLAERFAAAHRREQAQHVLSLIEASVEDVRATGLDYDYFATALATARSVVNGERAPRFVINHIRQLENAYRLGAIDEKRYASTRARLQQRVERKAAVAAEADELLRRTRFISGLPTDAHVFAHETSDRLVPEPGYYQSRVEELTSDQQAQYLRAFSGDNPPLDLVKRYAWVRLCSLLRSALFFVDSVDLAALCDEAKTLTRLQPKCDYYGERVAALLDQLAILDGSTRRKAAAAMREPLAPRTVGGGITIVMPTPELSPAFLDEALAICGRFT